MSSPLAVPESPVSSKRSRSRDSSHSAATTFHTPTGTPFLTPSASSMSLAIPNGNSRAPSPMEPSSQEAIPYPAFLRQNTSDVHNKFVELEWEQRKRLVGSRSSDGTPSQWARVSGEVAMNRNRYVNVDPYASNRVKLKVPDGHSDYINASPIVLKSSKSGTETKFIATQGPKADITSHIWRMVWHETTSPSVVVMLTQTRETGREKCYPYYPQSLSSPTLTVNEHDEFEDGFTSTLTLLSLEKNEDIRAQVREIEMSNTDGSESKKIWHLLFAGWPDFHIPEGADRSALLNLIAMSRQKNADNSENPRIVHCSAGVGRSGTFIALDWLLQELEEGSLDEVDDDSDPVVEVVDNLRQQRMMMVQGEAQFSFLYDILRDLWRERWAKFHPEEAEKLGLSFVQGEPAHKRAKPSEESEPHSEAQNEVSEVYVEGDEDERAELEAELLGSEMEFEKGKA
ncbi:hypothetical protein GQ43DRAFT_252281 [Delitschia confertaspora ATCC 74209]|uniref:Protein-tyrosine phosphatase n=1 Tax=Delitschia confertaspora ATCC 74209 TaxID=1513339 RepID=A0A9P4MTY2_9PLEO|nr:hypothetical protein GQ43DRAFT_252281 [Delitschia confertaspora ATCC 74209]